MAEHFLKMAEGYQAISEMASDVQGIYIYIYIIYIYIYIVIHSYVAHGSQKPLVFVFVLLTSPGKSWTKVYEVSHMQAFTTAVDVCFEMIQ